MGKFVDTSKLIIRALRRYVSLSFILAAMILLVRLYEIAVISNYYNYPPNSLASLAGGIKFDLILYLRVSAILLLPFLFIAYFSQKAAKAFFISASVFIVLADLLLLKYFATARVPLGSDLFGYSVGEIKQTIQSSGELSFWPFLVVGLFLFYMIRVFRNHVYLKLKPWMFISMVLLMFVSLLPLKTFRQNPLNYGNQFSMQAADNKLNFFVQSVCNHYLPQGKIHLEPDDLYAFDEYPFLHPETTPDVLGEYFEQFNTPPNLVFIVVEGLGRAFSGEGAYLGSFTPFLDSLMNKSLYWENCISTSGRTFQLLPSLLASAPFGESGFAELGAQMPNHVSLVSLLKKEAAYQSSFYYGGEAHFDNMDVFLRRQGIDKIIDSKSFGSALEKLPGASTGFSWGYGDKELFRRYFEEKEAETSAPSLDILLTLAMHDPFIIPDADFYRAKCDERLRHLNLTEKTRRFNLCYQKQLSTILYFDDALRTFFSKAQQQASFDNTIFIITGDHRMMEIPISTQLDRFHVPLLVYSPKLKQAQKFSSIVSHFDVTPSLIAMLHKQKMIERPEFTAWMGDGLQTQIEFGNRRSFPLMRNKNEIIDYVANDKMLSNGVIYQIRENMDIAPLDNQSEKIDLEFALANFLRLNHYVCTQNKLINDSL